MSATITYPLNSTVSTSSDNTTFNGIVLLWDIFYLQDLDFEAVQKVTGEIVPFTLSPADADNSRIDVFVQNDAGNIEVREGVPAVNEVKPEVDTSTEIEVTFVIIEANATSPQSVSRTLVYDENVGAPTEFEAQGAIAQGVNIAHVADADTGVTSILFKDYDNRASVDFTADAATDIANFSHFEFSVKFEIPGTSVIELLLTDGTVNSAPVFIQDGDYGLDFSNTQDFQKVRVPAQDFQYGSLVVFKISIRLYLNSDTATPAVLLDNISFVTGLTAIVLNSFFNLDDTPPSAEGLEGKYLQVINGRIVAVDIGDITNTYSVGNWTKELFTNQTNNLIIPSGNIYNGINGDNPHLLDVFKNGVLLQLTEDYTLTSSRITLATNLIADDVITIRYIKANAQDGVSAQYSVENWTKELFTNQTNNLIIPSGNIYNGINGDNPHLLDVFRNGVLLELTEDYTVASSRITLVTNLIAEDVIIIRYIKEIQNV